MKTATNLTDFLSRLRTAEIFHRIRDTRDGAISIDIAVPGERWEVEFLDDGSIEIEIFHSDGSLHDEAKLDELFEKFSD